MKKQKQNTCIRVSRHEYAYVYIDLCMQANYIHTYTSSYVRKHALKNPNPENKNTQQSRT